MVEVGVEGGVGFPLLLFFVTVQSLGVFGTLTMVMLRVVATGTAAAVAAVAFGVAATTTTAPATWSWPRTWMACSWPGG